MVKASLHKSTEATNKVETSEWFGTVGAQSVR